MRKLKLVISAILIIGATLSSCSSAADIDVSKLETPCDYMNALGDITKEAIDLKESVGDNKPSEGDMSKLKALTEKIGEIQQSSQSAGISEQDLMECEGAKEVMETLSQMR